MIHQSRKRPIEALLQPQLKALLHRASREGPPCSSGGPGSSSCHQADGAPPPPQQQRQQHHAQQRTQQSEQQWAQETLQDFGRSPGTSEITGSLAKGLWRSEQRKRRQADAELAAAQKQVVRLKAQLEASCEQWEQEQQRITATMRQVTSLVEGLQLAVQKR